MAAVAAIFIRKKILKNLPKIHHSINRHQILKQYCYNDLSYIPVNFAQNGIQDGGCGGHFVFENLIKTSTKLHRSTKRFKIAVYVVYNRSLQYL